MRSARSATVVAYDARRRVRQRMLRLRAAELREAELLHRLGELVAEVFGFVVVLLVGHFEEPKVPDRPELDRQLAEAAPFDLRLPDDALDGTEHRDGRCRPELGCERVELGAEEIRHVPRAAYDLVDRHALLLPGDRERRTHLFADVLIA